jgi:hypothetical protein
MTTCVVRGNDSHASFEITPAGRAPLAFDSFECAIQALAPTWGHCDTRVIGHGVEVDSVMFCCMHCAQRVGQRSPVDRVEMPAVAARPEGGMGDGR